MTYSIDDIAQRAYADINNYPSRYSVKSESEALSKLRNAYSVYKQKLDIYGPIYDEYNEYTDIIRNTPVPYNTARAEQVSAASKSRKNLEPYLNEAIENMQNAEVYVYAWGLVLDKIRGLEDNALNSSATTNINRYVEEAQTVNTVVTPSVSANQNGNKKMLFLAIAAAGLLLLLNGEN